VLNKLHGGGLVFLSYFLLVITSVLSNQTGHTHSENKFKK